MARILLVEDDQLQLEVRSRLLKLAGHDVIAASTREDAEKQLAGCEVLVTDLIPGSVELLSSTPRQMRVILLTGRDNPPPGVRVDRLLRKPCPTAALLDAIRQIS
jgi:CheY-like chemotaxis protein